MTLKWVKVGGTGPYRYDNIPGMDPAANWLLGPGIDAFLPEGEDVRVPFLFDFLSLPADPPTPPGFLPPERSYPRACEGLVIPYALPKTAFDAAADRAQKDKDFRLFFAKNGLSLALTSPHSKSAFPLDLEPWTELPVLPGPGLALPDDSVVMAVIDYGICFAHEAFRAADGSSRVSSFWIQDGDEPDAGPTVPFGMEILKEAVNGRPGIDDLLAGAVVPGGIDEIKIYREAGLADFSRSGRASAARRRAHGTHVLDLAAGYDPAANRQDRPIIAVQLPAEVVAQSTGAGIDHYVRNAVWYILERARRLSGEGPPLPVVINMSYGFIAGPHDGTTPLERALDQLLESYEGDAQMILSAGNSHLSRCYAEIVFEDGGDLASELHLQVHPDDWTSSYVEIWMPYDESIGYDLGTGFFPTDPRIEVSVVSPQGGESDPVPGEHGETIRLARDGTESATDAVAEVKYAYVDGHTQRGMFLVTLGPTARHAGETGASPDLAVAPSGIWRIRLHRKTLDAGKRLKTWIQRDDTIYGFPRRGRQSFFVNPCYQRFDVHGYPIVEDVAEVQDCAIRRRSLVSAVATGERVVVAGSYRLHDLHPAAYSAGQPITPERDTPGDDGLRKPDALMTAEGSRVHRGMLGAGSRSGSTTAMGGTSVAAPLMARLMADWMKDGAGTGRARVKHEAQVQQGAGGPFENAPKLDPNRGGWGRIEAPAQRISVSRFKNPGT